jgi:translation initiation factor IF-2
MELLKAGILLDKYGGETMHVPISAKKKIGLDKLEETILFKAELMELQEAADVRARGFIIESKILEGRGSLCSLIVKRGTLKIGDPIVAGSAHGIVKKLLDENMKEVKTASLSEAVEVIGFKGLPNMGDPFTVTTTIKRAEVIASYMKKSQTWSKLEEKRPEDEKLILPRMSSYERRKFMNRDPSLLVERLKNEVEELDSGKKSLEEISSIQKLMKFNDKTVQEHIDMISSLFDTKHEGPNVKIILKAKNMGMLEAMENTVKSLDNKNGVKLNIISAQIGSITNDDITIAEMFKAAILCMNVKLENNILAQAEKLKIPIKSHKIIYHLLQDVENLIKDQIMTEKIIVSGKAEVKNIYEISDKGKGKIKVAGLTVIDGSIIKRLLFKILRNGEEIASGLKVSSLKILKENAKEVKKGSECGLIFEDFDELKQGDLICSYEVKQLEKSFKNERKEVSFEDVKDK